MQTVQTAHILAIRTSLATEALGVCTVLDGQFLLVNDNIAVDVGHGHLGGRNQIEVVQTAMVHLSLLVGQLTSTITAGSIHHRGRHDLLVTGRASLVEEEVDKSTLQTRTKTTIHGETGTGNLHAKVKVNQVVLLAQVPVRQHIALHHGVGIPVAHGVHTLLALLQVGLHHPVVLGSTALGHLVVWNVGYLAELCCQVLLGLLHIVLQSLVHRLQFSHLGLHLLGLLLFALLHQSANLGSQFLGISQILVKLCLSGTALLVNLHHFSDSLARTGKMFFLQTGNDAFRLLGNQFKCKHLLF